MTSPGFDVGPHNITFGGRHVGVPPPSEDRPAYHGGQYLLTSVYDFALLGEFDLRDARWDYRRDLLRL